MSADKISCRQCGKEFITTKMFKTISNRIAKLGVNTDNYYMEICPSCRREAMAVHLIGSDLKVVPRMPYSLKRKTEPYIPVQEDPRTGATIYQSECFSCNCGCDVRVYVKNDKVIKVEGDPSSPKTKGTLCSKGLASKRHLYNPDRLKYPLIRSGKRGEGKWERISWEKALDICASRLQEVEKEYGPKSIALATGTSRGWVGFFARFASAWRKQWTGPGLAQCFFPRLFGQFLVHGCSAMECPDYENTRLMIIWGTNPAVTWTNKAVGMMDAKARGAPLIVVDPVLSETASKADLWLKLRPATDSALALGMLNVIINEKLYDREFVEKWCNGFDELKARVQEFAPDKVEDITWVPKEKIIEAARMYATVKPACITQALAIDQNADTISTARAIAMLANITGNIDVPGGNVIPMHLPFADLEDQFLRKRLTPENHSSRMGSKEYPLLSSEYSPMPSAHNYSLWQAVLTGKPYPIRAVYCQGNNMAISYSDTKLVTKALKSLDFFAVVDFYMTPTTELADLILPAGTWMERSSVTEGNQLSYNQLHFQQKVAQIGECWSDFKILIELSKRLGLEEFMFSSEEEYFDYLLKPSGLSWQEFKKRGRLTVPFEYRKYEAKGFNTPSGKVELSCQLLQSLGFDPLPGFREPPESPNSDPELAKKYPFILTTGAREPVYRHSEQRKNDYLRDIWPAPQIKINTSVADELGINEGDPVIVETCRGKMEGLACLREDIDPRVVQAPSHWPGKQNVNRITDAKNCAIIIGGTVLRSQLCRIGKGSLDE